MITMAYPFHQMTNEEISAFLNEPRFAVVATNRRENAAQLSPVWYLYEGGKLYVSIFKDSAKYRNIKRDPRVSACIAGTHPDCRAVTLTGTAELLQEGSAQWIDDLSYKVMRRYHDTDEEAQDYMDAEGGREKSALLVLTPDKILAQDFN